MKNITELKQTQSYLIEQIKLIKKNKNECINSLNDIKKEISEKCIEEFGIHSWIKEKEKCIYGETYMYCSRCGKDKYSQAIFDIL